jgi:SiaC family regulatory phosphoprotein
MESLILQAKEDTPAIVLDKEANKFSFTGVSLPEDVKEFYAPVMSWIDEYFQSPNDISKFEFKMTYFNTASSKIILDIMYKLKDAIDEGHKVEIEWGYFEDDEEMQEAGEDFSEIVEMPITIIEFK